MSEPTTIPGLMLRNAKQTPDKPAIREKDQGIWQTYTWSQYASEVEAFADGLAALGIGKDDKLSVIGDNRPRLYWAQVAIMGLGGVPVPVYQDAIANELSYVLNHAEVSVIVAEDQEQVDKILSIQESLPTLKWLIYDDPRGMLHYDDPIIKSFEEVEKLGREFAAANPGYFENSVSERKATDTAILCYTSGTTGDPKGVILSHDNFLSVGKILIAAEDARPDDDYLAYLPMAWVGDSLYGLAMSMLIGAVCNCPESPETVIRDLRELGPTGILAPPGIWESMLSGIQVKAANSSLLKRVVFAHFQAIADQVEKLKIDGTPVPTGLRLQYALGEFLVYGPVRDQLGLRRARWCLTGGAPLGPDTFNFFRSFGINLKQAYGVTEVTGLVSLQPDGEANPDTVGTPCEGIEVRIDDDSGEVLVRSPGTLKGYYKNEEATKEAVDEEGWFHTGDAGMMDKRGHLLIIDRAKDVGKLEDGTIYAPQFIENKLKFSPYIREAVSFGDARPYVCAMIAIDYENVGNWAERQSLPYTNYMDLAQKDGVRTLIADEIRKINQRLPDELRIKRFLLLTKDLDADDSEMTRTRKLRRTIIAERYAPVIDAFYGGQQNVQVELEVTFEDGSQSQVEAHMTIEEAA